MRPDPSRYRRCIYCRKRFLPSHKASRQCGRVECRRKMHRDYKRRQRQGLAQTDKAGPVRQRCRWCGLMFSRVRRRHFWYCSPECSLNGHRKVQREAGRRKRERHAAREQAASR